ncbi:MAG TPA: PAS domain-containing sensor histidine kinase [Gemmatimonadaceae bacterium]|nr:PAS domain-containing sensor histidine kinase [Gemmatimonadaceae bacterium]
MTARRKPTSTDSNPVNPAPVAPSEVGATREAAEFVGAREKHAKPPQGSGLYGLLVESVQDYAIFALDPRGYILSWNIGAARLKGYTADEIIGKHFSIFYPPEDIARGKTEWELEMAERDGRFEDENWRLKKDGSRFWANVIITALRAPNGDLVGFAKVTRDLTERKTAEERAVLDASRLAAAEAASKTKSEFLATMSHELRTPLNAIGGYAELIEMGVAGPISDEQRAYVSRIRSSQQHLLAIINDLLNYSRSEAGQVSYDMTRVSLHDVVERAMPMMLPQATIKGIAISHGPCTPMVEAWADRQKVEQIVLNLLSNAVKFTPSGGQVTVSCAIGDDLGTITVSDNGPGIPSDKLEAIFEPFVQLGRTLTSQLQGTGLGLAISRDLARAMSGDLAVENTPDGGATFTLSLPRAESTAGRNR